MNSIEEVHNDVDSWYTYTSILIFLYTHLHTHIHISNISIYGIASGFDLNSSPSRYAALYKAANYSIPVTTERITLVQLNSSEVLLLFLDLDLIFPSSKEHFLFLFLTHFAFSVYNYVSVGMFLCIMGGCVYIWMWSNIVSSIISLSNILNSVIPSKLFSLQRIWCADTSGFIRVFFFVFFCVLFVCWRETELWSDI